MEKTLPDDIVQKIYNNRMIRKNNIEQEKNKNCENIYSSIIDTIIQNPISGSNVVDILKKENKYYNFSECIKTERFKYIKKRLDVDLYILSGKTLTNEFENVKFEYNFNENDYIWLSNVTKKEIK
jgi:hypothetical protein